LDDPTKRRMNKHWTTVLKVIVSSIATTVTSSYNQTFLE
jgi:hypothetical protein